METTTLITEGGHKIVLKKSITGFEKQEITDEFLVAKDLTVKGKDGQMRPTNSIEQVRAIIKKGIETVVISVDGATDDIYNRVYNLDHNDTAEIKIAVDEITSTKKKSKSSLPTLEDFSPMDV